MPTTGQILIIDQIKIFTKFIFKTLNIKGGGEKFVVDDSISVFGYPKQGRGS
jgi:hypothetical protein